MIGRMINFSQTKIFLLPQFWHIFLCSSKHFLDIVLTPFSLSSLSHTPPPPPPQPSVYTHPYGTPLYEWTVEDVGDFLSALGYEAYIDKFMEHEIDGRALGLVRDHHLLMTMKLRLGPTLKICEQVQAIKASEDPYED